ncbi:MAG: hypothetical protein JRE28_08350 [Deltaproteobacteria bacterium]|nr:hypothetical protein [Deltaproteobacteria bacterium]
MSKKNCWEFLMCGREPGGDNVSEFGICPATLEKSLDGINQGKNGGRACWAISGTFCFGRVQEGFSSKKCDCERCDFYQLVQLEQGDKFLNTRNIRQQYTLKKKELLLCTYPERYRAKNVNFNSTDVKMIWD